MNTKKKAVYAANLRFARLKWGQQLGRPALALLKRLSTELQFSLTCGDLVLLDANWYVTNTGLLRLATRRRCQGIQVQLVAEFSDATSSRYAFKAIVYKSRTCQGFVGHGDANPSNVSFLVHGAEMRVAETRAVNRALRKAYGIGICSIEEIGSPAEGSRPPRETKETPTTTRKWELRRPQGPGSSLPPNSPAPARCHVGQVLRNRFLRSEDLTPSHARASRKLRRPLGRLGRQESRCPALPAQQLPRSERRCGMRRQIAGLHAADRCAADQIPDALYLVRVRRVQFRRQAQKPYYTVALSILEPSRFSDHIISSRLYCNPKALWKFNWFLRDFGYDVELLGRDEVDETQLIGLSGVVKISHVIVYGTSLVRLDGFAPADRWEELSPANLDGSKVA
jgi:hypothetical protein